MKMFAFDMLVVLCLFFAAEPLIYLAKCRKERENGGNELENPRTGLAIRVSYLLSAASAVAAAIVYFGFSA